MKNLAFHILDIVQNSIEANATSINIIIEEDLELNLYIIEIQDNGKGMDDETLKKCIDPYYTSRNTRKVGLGLPLLKQNSEKCNGKFEIRSYPGIGTTVNARFAYDHIDRPPLGDISDVIILLLFANPAIRFIYTHKTNSGRYYFDSDEIYQIIGIDSLFDVFIRKYLKEMIEENLFEINFTN